MKLFGNGTAFDFDVINSPVNRLYIKVYRQQNGTSVVFKNKQKHTCYIWIEILHTVLLFIEI